MWPHIQSQLRTPGPTGVTMALISFWPNYFSAQNLNVEESARPRWTQRSRGRRSRRTPSTTWTRRRRWVTRTATRVSDAGKWLWDESAVSQWPICPFLNKRLRTTRPSRMCKTTATATTATTPWSVLTTANRSRTNFLVYRIDVCVTLKLRLEDPAVFRPRNPVMTRTRPGKVLRGVPWKTMPRLAQMVERFWETATIVIPGKSLKLLFSWVPF